MTAAEVRSRYVFLIAMRWLPVGLLVPIMVLLPLERGLDIAQIGSVVAIKGIVVLLLELPTGGLADAMGRRPVLLIAGAVNLASLMILTVADTTALFGLAYLLQGVYRALDSGPLESWFVDQSSAADPEADIETGLSRGGTASGLAIAGTALLSGGLVWLGPVGPVSALAVPVLVSVVLSLLGTLATAVLMTEQRPPRGRVDLFTPLRGMTTAIGGALGLARRSRVVLALLVVEIMWSFGMVTFEQLMPVRLSEVTTAAGPLMGPVSSVAWAAAAAGAALIPLLSRRIGARWTGFMLRLAHGATIVGMGLLAGPAGVIGAFLLCYAVHGATTPVHSGLLHSRVDGEYRTSLLSLNSMVAAMGFAAGSVVLSMVAARAGTPVAIVAGAALLAAAAPLYLVEERSGASGPEFREHSHPGTSELQAP